MMMAPFTNMFSVTGPGAPIRPLKVPVVSARPPPKLSPVCRTSISRTCVPENPDIVLTSIVFAPRSGMATIGTPVAFTEIDEKLASEPEKAALPVPLLTLPTNAPLSKTEIIIVAWAEDSETDAATASATAKLVLFIQTSQMVVICLTQASCHRSCGRHFKHLLVMRQP